MKRNKYNFLEKKLKWNSIHHLGTKYIAKINKLQRWSFLSVIHEMNVHEWRVLNFAKFFIIFELLTARSSELSLGFWFRDEGGPDMYILQCLFLFRLNCCDYNWKNDLNATFENICTRQNEVQILSALFWQKISKNARALVSAKVISARVWNFLSKQSSTTATAGCLL